MPPVNYLIVSMENKPKPRVFVSQEPLEALLRTLENQDAYIFTFKSAPQQFPNVWKGTLLEETKGSNLQNKFLSEIEDAVFYLHEMSLRDAEIALDSARARLERVYNARKELAKADEPIEPVIVQAP